MNQLSPAAQAVMDAWVENTLYEPIDNEPLALAAALRAAVEETQGTVVCPSIEMVTTNHRYCLASDILAIATELEGQ